MNTPSSTLPIRHHPRARHVAAVLAAWSLLVVSTAVWAQATPEAAAVLPNTTTEWIAGAPRWHGEGTAHSAVEMDLRQPVPRLGGAPADEASAVQLRLVRWAPAGAHSAMGLSVGVGAIQSPNGAAPPWNGDARNFRTAVLPEVGVRLRTPWRQDRRVDAGAWGAYDTSAGTPADQRRSYNARVELQFRESRNKFGIDLSSRAFGMQLSSNSQMLLRSKHGGPMLYYRAKW